jgi:hypothetical protein
MPAAVSGPVSGDLVGRVHRIVRPRNAARAGVVTPCICSDGIARGQTKGRGCCHED